MREPDVIVDIGYGPNRDYQARTNEYGQVVEVWAKEIILQDDDTEAVTSKNRYCNDEAKVPGTEAEDLDEGHIIADSLGGVSNAYNITPQDSHVNREGEQALMEQSIRDAGGAYDFYMEIKYPSTDTQIPESYSVRYIPKGQDKQRIMHYGNGRYGHVDNDDSVSETQAQPEQPAPAPLPTSVPTPAQPAPGVDETVLPPDVAVPSTQPTLAPPASPSAEVELEPDSDLARTGSSTRFLGLCLFVLVIAAYALYRVRVRS